MKLLCSKCYIHLTLHGESHVEWIEPQQNKTIEQQDTLVCMLSTLLRANKRDCSGVDRFVSSSFHHRWNNCPWSPSLRGLHSYLKSVKVSVCMIHLLLSTHTIPIHCNGVRHQDTLVHFCITAAHRSTRTIQGGITNICNAFGPNHRYLTWQSRTACEDPICQLVEACATDWWLEQWPSLAAMVRNPGSIYTVGMPPALGHQDPSGSVRNIHLGLLPHLAILLCSVWDTIV